MPSHGGPERISGQDSPSATVAPLVLLLGPTAGGKTALGVALAERLGCRVLSVDSRQVYVGMDIGTAKPTLEERRGIPHDLLDLAPPDRPLNLNGFCALAGPLIAAQRATAGLALLVGGSGLYQQALGHGLLPPSVAPQPALRRQLEVLDPLVRWGLLRAADPEAAERLHPADALRIVRALEVLYASGRPLSQQQGRRPPPGPVLELGLDPPDLRQRIAGRTALMIRAGLLEETEVLRRRFGAQLPLLRTIGYAEALAVLEGRLDREAAAEAINRRTWQFARRQRTWFRHRHNPLWLNPESPLESALTAVTRCLTAGRSVAG
jgi:tRNA dimethylallyltransferase